jgi:hypothetical protein
MLSVPDEDIATKPRQGLSNTLLGCTSTPEKHFRIG